MKNDSKSNKIDCGCIVICYYEIFPTIFINLSESSQFVSFLIALTSNNAKVFFICGVQSGSIFWGRTAVMIQSHQKLLFLALFISFGRNSS